MLRTRTPPRSAAITHAPSAISPSREIQALQNRMRRFIDAPFGRLLQEPFVSSLLPESIGWMPSVEVSETDGEYIVTAELPGMKRENVNIVFEDGVLTVEGEKKEEHEEEKNGHRQLVWERTFGSFQRSFGFPSIDDARITAEMRDGVLTVKLPKMAEAKPTGRRIVIAEGK